MNPREKKLLLFLVVSVFLMGHILLLPKALKFRDQTTAEMITLDSQMREARFWLEDKSLWESRRQWIESNAPRYSSDGAAGASLLEAVQAEAAKGNISLSDVLILDREKHDSLHEAGVKMTAVGPSKEMIAWIHSVQKPSALRGIKELSVKVEEDRKEIRCQLHIIDFYFQENKE